MMEGDATATPLFVTLSSKDRLYFLDRKIGQKLQPDPVSTILN